MPVPAQRVADDADLDVAPAGAFQFEAFQRGMFYVCPCGCGTQGYLGFRGLSDPPHPSWEWDGNPDQPTLSPSIQRTAGCRWHGYLTKGMWQGC
jgi:hypothetical protein